MITLTALLLLGSFHGCSAGRVSLNGNKWTVSTNDGTTANVPGGIYSDLMNGKFIDDVFYKHNDIKYRWVAYHSWTYNYTFNLDETVLKARFVNLVFEGVDTISSIFLNGRMIGSTDNMFIRYVYNVKNVLRSKNNDISITFSSPTVAAKELFDKQAEKYVVHPTCVPTIYNGECHVNFLRKMQASFAWDWGPAFPSVGIWKPVFIEYFNETIIRNVAVELIEKDDDWHVNLTVFMETQQKLTGSLTAMIETNVGKLSVVETVKQQMADGEVAANVVLQVPKLQVDLWWPNGYGKPKLYNVVVSYSSSSGVEQHNKSIEIGFRTIQLVQKPLEDGLTFYFKVNNVVIFAKGSNWIPASILPEKGYRKDRVNYLLKSAQNANMNMLRVWGGGVYESDYFYKLADRLGLLIWQDFMFACALYPVNDEFLKSVDLEIKQQVRRLQYHPSIAVWGGNNENELAIVTGWWPMTDELTYKKDYITLYVKNVRKVCLENDATRSFVVSSPSNGVESEREGYFAKKPADQLFGDVHVYEYLLDGWDQNIYPKPRFASEYGFQSLPSYETLQSATDTLDKKFFRHRQHHLGGYEEIEFLIKRHMKMDKINSTKNIRQFIYYSQISQAMAVKAETENYRQMSSVVQIDGRGLTKGAMYWQLNDVWQAPSWSSIDFHGRWKMLHYFAKKFFYPVIVSPHLKSSRCLTTYVISDLIETIPEATLYSYVYNWDNFTPLHNQSKTVTILPGFSKEADSFFIDEHLTNVGCGASNVARNRCFMIFELRAKDGRMIGYENFLIPGKIKEAVGITEPNFTIKVSQINYHQFSITVTSDRIALFVWLETPKLNGIFSENGFILYQKQKVVLYDIPQSLKTKTLEEAITITSLYNN